MTMAGKKEKISVGKFHRSVPKGWLGVDIRSRYFEVGTVSSLLFSL